MMTVMAAISITRYRHRYAIVGYVCNVRNFASSAEPPVRHGGAGATRTEGGPAGANRVRLKVKNHAAVVLEDGLYSKHTSEDYSHSMTM
jgi:hypothetical protein